MKVFERQPAYEKLKFYQQICEIRRFVYVLTERLIKTHPRLVSQMRDAARSAKQNVREGYRKGNLGEFIRSLKISQGSLEELSGDIEDCEEDGLITRAEFTQMATLFKSVDLLMSRYVHSLYTMQAKGTWKTPGKSK